MVELYPPHKEAAKRVAAMDEGESVSVKTLEEWFREASGTTEFELELWKLRTLLREEHEGRSLRPWRADDGERFYRISPDEERVTHHMTNNLKAIQAAIRRNQVIGAFIDPEKLTDKTRELHEHYGRKTAFFIDAERASTRPKILEQAHRALVAVIPKRPKPESDD